MRREILSEEEVQQAYERWINGEQLFDISESLYVCSRTLLRAFKRRGKKKPRKHRPPK